MLIKQKKCDNCGGTLAQLDEIKWQCIYCKTIYTNQGITVKKESKTEIDGRASVEQVCKYILSLKNEARMKGNNTIILRSGDIHKNLGLVSRMPTVCGAMRKMMNEGDIILHQTPSGNSSTLLIQYHLT